LSNHGWPWLLNTHSAACENFFNFKGPKSLEGYFFWLKANIKALMGEVYKTLGDGRLV